AKHRADGGRRDLTRIWPPCGIERIVLAPVAREDVPVYVSEVVVEPALDGSSVAMWRKSQRRRSGRPPPDAIRIYRNLLGVEVPLPFAFGPPKAVHEDTSAGERLRLARQNLRPRPVDSENLRPGCPQIVEIFVFGCVRELLTE